MICGQWFSATYFPSREALLIFFQAGNGQLSRHGSLSDSSAEVPDKNINPLLFDTVMRCMLHGPCSAANPKSPCMKDGKCSKGYLKLLVEVARANENRYPESRRRRRDPGVLNYKGKIYDTKRSTSGCFRTTCSCAKGTTVTSTSRCVRRF
jgi:hypothetical protein